MLRTTKSISVSGQSFVEGDKGNNVQVAYMNANIPDDGQVSINKSITDKELFNEHKEEVMKDFSEFEAYVYSLVD